MTALQQGPAMDDQNLSISERLHALLPPALDDPTRQRDLRTVAWLVDLRFDKIDRRFDEMERRFDDVERKFDEIERRFDDVKRQFDDVKRQFDDVQQEMKEMRQEFASFSLDLKSTIFKLFVGLFGATVTTVLASMALLLTIAR
jgi:septal ring factor EnvC (AmiA/AmiB activator)